MTLPSFKFAPTVVDEKTRKRAVDEGAILSISRGEYFLPTIFHYEGHIGYGRYFIKHSLYGDIR
jgi:hypothetical protein